MIFLYKQVLHKTLEALGDVPRAQRSIRLPVVFSREEINSVLDHVRGAPKLVVKLLYGSGMRLLEALRLRIHDIDFEN